MTRGLVEQHSDAGTDFMPLVQVEDLTKHYPVRTGRVRKKVSYLHAVDGVSFELRRRETLGLVGESGSGKTTVGKMLVRLLEPTSGHIYYLGTKHGVSDLANLKKNELKAFRRESQMIFQDPYSAMDPRQVVLDVVAEPLIVQRIGNAAERLKMVEEMLELVGMSPAASFMPRSPHELSGGQLQRVAIARALILSPNFVVADEPTSMLDVSVRSGIMTLLNDLTERSGASVLYITHDLAVARYMCDRIAVMYQGKIVETAETEELLGNPVHPYTKALVSAVPTTDPTRERQPPNIGDEVPKAVDPINRCRFYERCPKAVEFCRVSPPPPLENKASKHKAACYRA